MTLPFEEAANPASVPAFEKRLIVLDWNGTLCLADGTPNKYLYLLANTAAQNGHEVVIATLSRDHELLKMMVNELHPPLIGFELPDFRIFNKAEVRQKMKAEGHDQAFYVFDNEPETISNYIDTKWFAEVLPNGRVPDLQVAAILLKIEDQFASILKKYTEGKPIFNRDFV